MTQHSFPWNDVNGDKLYDAEDFMRFFAAFLKTGVVMSFEEGLRVRSAQNGMNIQVGKGSGVIAGNSYMNDEAIAIQVDVASSVQNRIDSVVLRMDKNARDTYLYYKPSDTTVVRNDVIYELQLAKISVKMNATQITDADITDMRSDSTVCGWATPFDNINVDGIVDQYKGIFAQADVEFQAWFQNLKDQLDENQAANLQNQINNLQNTMMNAVLKEEDGTVSIEKLNVSEINLTGDTDWSTVTLGDGFSLGQISIARCKKKGNIGQLHVRAVTSTAAFVANTYRKFTQLPEELIPLNETIVVCGEYRGNAITCYVNTSGVVSVKSLPDLTSITTGLNFYFEFPLD